MILETLINSCSSTPLQECHDPSTKTTVILTEWQALDLLHFNRYTFSCADWTLVMLVEGYLNFHKGGGGKNDIFFHSWLVRPLFWVPRAPLLISVTVLASHDMTDIYLSGAVGARCGRGLCACFSLHPQCPVWVLRLK